MTTNLWVSVTLLAIAGLGTSQAAEKIRFDEIPTRLAPFGTVLAYRGFNVTTLDGKQHRGRRLLLQSDHVRIFDRKNHWEDLSSDEIARIEINQHGRFIHHVVENAPLPVLPIIGCLETNTGYCILGIGLVPIFLAEVAVTTPFFLAADSIAFFIPPKVYEIVH
ncbi:MAG: hypothetical protein ABSH09_33835 [Bryobacteraceae bacterium]|jgi:hypothetical protein